MGTFVGHAAPGFGFFIIGVWHLFNHIKSHSQNPKKYTSFLWFPSSITKYLELFFIIASSIAPIFMELFVGHLPNFEDSYISITFLVYATFSIILDKFKPPSTYELTQLLGAFVFGQQLLFFHLYSDDHMGVEGRYHSQLQIVIFISLITTLFGIVYPKSFVNSFVRSFSILFEGVWLMVMGFMLSRTTQFSDEDLERAKSLVNIQFSWYLIGVTIFVIIFYLVIVKFYHEGKVEYQSLMRFAENEDQEDDVEVQKERNIGSDQSHAIGKSFAPVYMEK